VSRSPSQPEFFVDRSLGRIQVPRDLRKAGWTLRTHSELYGDRDEEVADTEWLEMCGREDLPVLSKDRRLRYRRQEIAALRRHRVRAFVLTRGSLRAEDQVRRFDGNRAAIEAACQEPGPFVYAVHGDRIVKVFPA
jgi:uncharacterized protein with PIN domain